jgi:uncharacterized protein YndB with AHSA1/START domain
MHDIRLSAVRTEAKEYTITCLFEASPQLVFKVFTDPTLIPAWWGPIYLTTHVEKMDLRPAGGWRFIQHDQNGNEFAFHGVYREIVPPERLVFTFELEGAPGYGFLETITFAPQAGKTLLTDTSLYQSAEDLDRMLETEIEGGAAESMQRLAALLMRIKQQAADESSLPKGLSNPARRALAGASIENIEQLAQHSEAEIKELHGIGPSAMDLLRNDLEAHGLTFADSK